MLMLFWNGANKTMFFPPEDDFDFSPYQDYQHQQHPDFTTLDALQQLSRVLVVVASGLTLFLLGRTFPAFAPFSWIAGGLAITGLVAVAVARRDIQFWIWAMGAFASVLLSHWDLVLGVR